MFELFIVKKTQTQQKLWSSGRALSSQFEGRGFNSHPMLDGSGVKAIPGPIPAPNSGSLQKIRKIQVAKWGTRTKKEDPNLFYSLLNITFRCPRRFRLGVVLQAVAVVAGRPGKPVEAVQESSHGRRPFCHQCKVLLGTRRLRRGT